MKTSWLSVVAVLLAAALYGLPQQARAQDALPPTIMDFRVDLETIALPDAEAGETPAVFEWQTVGLSADRHLTLEALVLDAWVSVAPDDAVLEASGSLEILVAHPLSFRPPTYRLAILDTQDAILDQWIVVIAYEEGDDEAPEILGVTAGVESVSLTELTGGSARIPVLWEVANRPPGTNLMFEQVLDDGAGISVELPRPNLWVPSRGEGWVAPFSLGATQPVRLQMRLVDMRDGSTLAEQVLPPIRVVSVVTPPADQVASPPAQAPATPAPSAAVEILSFTAAPQTVPRGGTVTIAWEAAGANQVTVWRISPTGQIAEEAPVTTPTGSWTVTLPEYHVDTASFSLNAFDAAGRMTGAGLTINVICPFTYFFAPDETLSCPLGPPATVQAAWQAYEHGFMLWRADTGEILVAYARSGRVERYRDTWQGETITYPEEPPAGMHAPARGFGKVWVDNPAVRQALGWPTTLEQGYTMQYQSTGDFRYPRFYMTLPDGSLIYIVENIWTAP